MEGRGEDDVVPLEVKEETAICVLGSLLGAQRRILRRTNRPAGRFFAAVFSVMFNGGNPGGGVTGETRASRPGVLLNKSIGDGTPGSFAGGILAAGCSQGVRGVGGFVGERREVEGLCVGGRVG